MPGKQVDVDASMGLDASHARYEYTNECSELAAAAHPADTVTPETFSPQDTLEADAAGVLSVNSNNTYSFSPISPLPGTCAPVSQCLIDSAAPCVDTEKISTELLFLDTPRSQLLRVPARIATGD